MINDIKKEVSENIEHLTTKTRKMAVKLVSFVISCWLVIGTLAIGLIVPVQVAKSVMRIEWVKEAKAANVERPARQTTTQSYPYSTVRNYGSAPAIRQQPQPTLRSGLQQTGDAVNQLRSLASGFRALASR